VGKSNDPSNKADKGIRLYFFILIIFSSVT
jgi:hypothetical protein